MGSVVDRVGKDGKKSYQAKIRKKGVNLTDTFDTEDKAKNWIIQKEAQILNGENLDIHKVRKLYLKDIFQEYIDDGKINDAKKAGMRRLIKEIGGVIFENFNTKTFGKYLDKKLNQKIPPQANKEKEHPLFNGGKVLKDGEWVQKTYSAGTVRKLYYHIKTALEWHAKQNDYQMDTRPFDNNQPPGAWDNPKDRMLEDDEIQRLLKATDKSYVNQQVLKEMILFQIFSCMRMGEALKCRWKDLVFSEELPSSSHIFIPKEHQKTRNKKSVFDRFVPIQPKFYKLVKEHILPRRGNAKDDDLVFPFWKSTSAFYAVFRVVSKNAEVKDISPHIFRHTGISHYFMFTDLPDGTIMKITGHIEHKTILNYLKLRKNDTGERIWASLGGEIKEDKSILEFV